MNAAGGLLALQRDFQSSVLGEPSGVAAHIRPGGIGVERRLRIYREAYRARLVGAVREGHGHLATWLGDDDFDALALAFVDATPSAAGNLRWYAEGFAAWLAHALPGRPAAAELATLDWGLRCAFDGPDARPLALDDIGRIPPQAWSTLALEPHPTARLCSFAHNVVSLWRAVDDGSEPPDVVALEAPLEVLVWRRGLQPHFRSVNAFESAALRLLLDGVAFAASCEQLAAAHPRTDTAGAMGSLLRRWVEEGLLSGIQGLCPADEASR